MSVYSQGNPTDEEQYVLELINRARANPPAEGVRLSTTTDPEIGNEYTQWGTPTRAQVKSDFAGYAVRPPLAFNADLITAARAHSQDMITNNFQGHNSNDGTTFDARVHSYGYAGGYIGENVFCYGVNPWDIHASFQIDFGNPGLGHRQNIMNFDLTSMFPLAYTEVGLGILHGGTGLPNVGPEVTTEDFGNASQTFILGVVYNDLNHNGFYDPGEGLAGVTIKPSSGGYTAITSSSGGYAIPFSGNSSVTVTASGPGLATPVSHTIDFNAENVKIDFQPDKSGLPGIATLLVHTADTVNYDTTRLIWNKVTGAQKYRMQFGRDPLFKALLINDSTLTDSARSVSSLMEDSTYYWRIQAKNLKGWGDYSAAGKFHVLYLPSKVTLLTPKPASVLPFADTACIWNNSSPRVGGYWFQLATDAAMTHLVIDDNSVFDTTRIVTKDLLTDGTKYYWQVRALNDAGWSAPSAVSSFTVISAGVADRSGAFSVKVTPNPSNGAVHFFFVLDRSNEVELTVFNTNGEAVDMKRLGTMGANTYDFQWDGSKLAAGNYFYQLRIGDKYERGSIVLKR